MPFLTPTIESVAGRLGRTLTATEQTQLDYLIGDTIAAMEARIGTSFAEGTTTETLTTSLSGRVVLSSWPVVSIDSITDSELVAVTDYTLDSANGIVHTTYSGLEVIVNYTHGYSTTPALLEAMVAQIAGRALGTPADRSGITSETTGPYNFQIGAAAASGPTGLLRSEQDLLMKSFGRRVPKEPLVVRPWLV